MQSPRKRAMDFPLRKRGMEGDFQKLGSPNIGRYIDFAIHTTC
jgi:hypothetical protein